MLPLVHLSCRDVTEEVPSLIIEREAHAKKSSLFRLVSLFDVWKRLRF